LLHEEPVREGLPCATSLHEELSYGALEHAGLPCEVLENVVPACAEQQLGEKPEQPYVELQLGEKPEPAYAELQLDEKPEPPRVAQVHVPLEPHHHHRARQPGPLMDS